ncbi:MFS transporter [Gordonia polyisoprenivorans]|uniref:MFS transporter n=1 Tax=Gordonia polyisoprenivorans TaxID=84595 RepID=UPI001FCB462C|nr:MFS transporter [Gordonia polyisoprenivorans]
MTQRTFVTGKADAGGSDRYVLDSRTLIAAAAAIALAQAALAMPAVLNGLFQDDLGTSASQLTWISAAFLVPVTLFELTFGVLGDLFGRKRLLIIGTIVLGVGQLIGFLTPGCRRRHLDPGGRAARRPGAHRCRRGRDHAHHPGDGRSGHAHAGAVHSGPLGANGVPATVMVDGKSVPLNPLQSVAFDALDHSYSMAFVVRAGAALLATLIVGIGFTGVESRSRVSGEPETV